MTKRALLVVNQQARQGDRDLNEIQGPLRGLGLELVEAPATHGAALADLIRSSKNNVDLVIIGGGDGTLNAAADGLVDARLPLGILPLGTANDLARTLAIPTDLAEACQVIANGHTKLIDVGWVNGKHFFNVASIGLSVEIARRLTKESKSRWGIFAYLATAARALWYARPHRAEIHHNGQTYRVKTLQVAVGNGRFYGGGMAVAEDAAIDDGVLDLYLIGPHVRVLKGQEFQVNHRRPRPVNTDGEISTRTPAHFRLVPQSLPVIVPRQMPA